MKKFTAPVLWFIVILLLGSAFSPTKFIRKVQAQADDQQVILVKLKEPPKTSAILSLSTSIPEGEFAGGLPETNLVVYSVNGDTDTALTQARANPNVQSAFRDAKIKAFRTTNDGRYENQWSLFRMKVGTNPNATPPVDSAWDKITYLSAKTAAIKVAVLDSGIDFSLLELQGKESGAVTCSFDSGESGTDCTAGGNDDYGHGTHVAGIIGANTNNNLGIAGVGWGVKLLSVKVLDNSGEGDFRDVLLGIQYAADNGAKVINLSLGAIENLFDDDYVAAINDFTNDAYNKGVVIVASAGNCGDAVQHVAGELDACDKLNDDGTYNSHITNPKMYPAAAEHVLAVGAMGRQNELAAYSEYGNWVDLAAPGGFGTAADPTKLILSTMKESYCAPLRGIKPTGTQNLCYLQGTSMSAPHVAGVLALIFAKNPNLTPDQAVAYLTSNADRNLPTDNTDATIYGGVNALASLTDVNANATPTGFASPSPTGPTRTPTPTSGPTLAPSITSYPTTGAAVLPRPSPNPAGQFCPEDLEDYNCLSKSSGDANCDGAVNAVDYSIWKEQYDKLVGISDYQIENNANFSCVEGNTTTYYVDLVDFEIWRRGTSGFANLTPTLSPSNTPVQPSNTPSQPSNTPRPPTNTPRPPTNTPRPPTHTPVPESCTELCELDTGTVPIDSAKCDQPEETGTKDGCGGAGGTKTCMNCGSGYKCYGIDGKNDCGCSNSNRLYCNN